MTYSRQDVLRVACAWVAAVAATYVVAAALASQFNLVQVREMGLSPSIGQRFYAAWHDIMHMVDIYLPVIAIALLLALPVAAWLSSRFHSARLFLYALAGFTALLAIHGILYLVFGMSPVAATRETTGLLAQGLAGALGGVVFYMMPGRSTA